MTLLSFQLIFGVDTESAKSRWQSSESAVLTSPSPQGCLSLSQMLIKAEEPKSCPEENKYDLEVYSLFQPCLLGNKYTV